MKKRSVLLGVVLVGEERHDMAEGSEVVLHQVRVAVVPEPVTALRLEGVTYRPLIRPSASVDLVVAHRADRPEPHLARTVEVIRALF